MQATIIPGANIEANIEVSGPPSDDYENLRNKPQINGCTLIGNKTNSELGIPTKTSDIDNDSDFVSDAGYVHTDNNYTDAEVSKLEGIEAGAEVNVQSDWEQSDSTADNYIKNKPENLVQDASYVHTDNNYTTVEKNKLSGIAAGAEVNVQSDWNQTSSSSDDYIKNKPENLVQDANYVHTDNNYTSTEKTKLSGIAPGAEVNVQSDWNEADDTKDGFIKNKPDLTAYIQKSQTAGLFKNDGTIDTNTYATTSQIPDISGKADKSEMTVTDGTGTDVDKVIIQLKSGTSAKVLKTHQDISGKVDKVTGKGLSTNDYTDTEKTKLQPGFPLPAALTCPPAPGPPQTSTLPKLSSRAHSRSMLLRLRCAAWGVPRRTRSCVRSSLVAAASGWLSCSPPGAPHRGPPGLVTLVGCLSTGPLYKSGFWKVKGFLCVKRRAKEQKRFLAAGKSIPPHVPVPPEDAVPASVGLLSSGRGLFPHLPGSQDTLGMHPRTDPEACGGRRSEVGPVIMKGSSVRSGGRIGGQAWLLDPAEDFRLRPDGGEGVTEGFERKGWLR